MLEKTMEKGTSKRSNTQSYLSTLFDDDEIFVSHILLDFSNLILLRELPNQFPATWVCKRKRSAFDSSSLKEEEEREKGKKLKVKVSETLSPDTPFSFSPSESDENSKHSHKQIFTKTTKEEHLKMIDELTQGGEALKGEIEAVKSYYNKLKSINLDLKAKKQELEMTNDLDFGMDLSKSIIRVENQDDHPQFHCMAHHGSQTSNKFQQHPYSKISPFLSSGSGSGKVNQMGPLCIPYLKVSEEETLLGVDSSQPLDSSRALLLVLATTVDDKKAKAAEARRRRVIKMKEMKKNSFAKIKPPKCR